MSRTGVKVLWPAGAHCLFTKWSSTHSLLIQGGHAGFSLHVLLLAQRNQGWEESSVPYFNDPSGKSCTALLRTSCWLKLGHMSIASCKERLEESRFYFILKTACGLCWWFSGKEFACQCRRHGLDPRSEKIPRVAGPGSYNYWAHMSQLLKHACPGAMLHKRGHRHERPVHCSWRAAPAHTTREKPTQPRRSSAANKQLKLQCPASHWKIKGRLWVFSLEENWKTDTESQLESLLHILRLK